MPDIEDIVGALDLTKVQGKTLGLAFATCQVTPGQRVPKAEAQKPPELSFDGATGSYIVIGLDLDAPFPSFNALSPILHWLQSDLTPEKPLDGRIQLKATKTPFISNYIAPAPPSPSSEHRYVFLLYKQPEGFDFAKYAPEDGKPRGLWQRIRYNLAAFEQEAKLGPIVACNYFFSI